MAYGSHLYCEYSQCSKQLEEQTAYLAQIFLFLVVSLTFSSWAIAPGLAQVF